MKDLVKSQATLQLRRAGRDASRFVITSRLAMNRPSEQIIEDLLDMLDRAFDAGYEVGVKDGQGAR